MKKYQIKLTCLEGEYAGKNYLLTKGGYVSKGGFQLPEFCYLKESVAKAVCTRYMKNTKGSGWKFEVVEVE